MNCGAEAGILSPAHLSTSYADELPMARVRLSFPDDAFSFTTEMPVRITDVNGANHLGNDALISMLSEARAWCPVWSIR